MPELPEVETIRRSLAPVLVGRLIEDVTVRERRLRSLVDTRRLRRCCRSKRVEGLSRRAKYLVIHLQDDWRLLIHFGMSGRLLLREAGEAPVAHEHVVFHVERGLELRFQDHRRFGLVEAFTAAALRRDPRLAALGVEPLSLDCTAAHLRSRACGLRRPIKSFLMDARHLVGVGNIYASEALFLAGVHPERAAGRLSLVRWERLTAAVKQILADAIDQGGTTLRDFRSSTGEKGYFQVRLRVYQREGEGCSRCRGKIRRRVQAGRSTFYCPRCQR